MFEREQQLEFVIHQQMVLLVRELEILRLEQVLLMVLELEQG